MQADDGRFGSVTQLLMGSESVRVAIVIDFVDPDPREELADEVKRLYDLDFPHIFCVSKLDRSSGQRATHQGRSRPADAPLSHSRIHRRELSAAGRPPPAPKQELGVATLSIARRLSIILAPTQRCIFLALGAAPFKVLPHS
jgi:hypothetical protein